MFVLLKRSFKKLVAIIKYSLYNRKNNVNIQSLSASLKANYGKGVSVGKETFVADNVSLGNYSYINRKSSVEYCRIGNYCSISSGVYINPYEHELNYRSTHPFAEKGYDKRKEVIIGHDVLISLNAIILNGVKIGNGAVVAAGAVVTKDVAPYEIVGGVPAKHIGWRFDEDERERIEKTQWFLYDKNTFTKNIKFFTKETDDFRV